MNTSLKVCKNSPKLTIYGIFDKLFSTQTVNVWYLIWYLLYISYSFSFCFKVLLMSLQFKSVKWPIKKGEHVNWQSCSKCSNRPRKLKFFFVTLQHSALGFRSEKLISWEREIVVHKLLSKKVFMLRSKSLLSDLGGAERDIFEWEMHIIN